MSTGSWLVVLLAGALAAAVLGGLFALPLRVRPPRLGSVSTLLSVHAGGVAVVGTVVVAAAVRSWQLVDRPTEVAHSLLEVSRLDGDGSMFALLVLFLTAAVVAATALLLLAARLAASDDPSDRTIACAVLAVEIALSGYGLTTLVGGSRSVPALLALANLPLAMAGLVSCWPSASTAES